jgi:two-component system, OmpR family, response regulator MprA
MPRVLVIDGYEESRDASARELRVAGYDVIAVEEEEQAVGAIARATVDIVVLDLPLAEAEEAARALRAAAPRGRAMTLIALADPSSSRRTRDQARASGIDYFLLRPCPPPEIVKHLRRMRRS